MTIRLFVLLAPAALGVLSSGCGKPQAEAAKQAEKPAQIPPVKVKTGPVEIRKMPRYLTLTGSIYANRQSELAANVNGRIAATLVERGQPVKQGQTIAVVDAKAAGLSASAASAQYNAAETQVAQAKADCERADKLFAAGAMSPAEHSRMKSQCTAQLYSATASRANADIAAKLAGDTVIRAPFDGVIGERYVNLGEYVTPMSRVASLFAVDPARIQISVPEPAVGKIKEGQTLEVHVAAYPDRAFAAQVKYVSAALRPQTRDLLVEAVAPNAAHELKPGMFATVLLRVGEEELPTVPIEALRIDGTVKRMFLAQKNQAVELVVRTGATLDGRVAVLEALKEGDPVIVSPPPGLRDGATIEQ